MLYTTYVNQYNQNTQLYYVVSTERQLVRTYLPTSLQCSAQPTRDKVLNEHHDLILRIGPHRYQSFTAIKSPFRAIGFAINSA